MRIPWAEEGQRGSSVTRFIIPKSCGQKTGLGKSGGRGYHLRFVFAGSSSNRLPTRLEDPRIE